MFPYVNVLGKVIGLYQIMILCGIFSVGIYTCNAAKKEKHNENDMIILLLIVSMGVFLGSHILYALVNIKNVTGVDGFFNRVVFLFGGSVFYGGLLGGMLVFFVINKLLKTNYAMDIITPAIPLFHFFGRIGCFLAGCCFGIQSSFGLTYRHSLVDAANGVNRFPVQILEAVFNLMLFIALLKIRKLNILKEKLFYVYLLAYSCARFLFEFLRGDDYRGKILFLSTSQFISIIVFSFALYKLHRKRGKQHKQN